MKTTNSLFALILGALLVFGIFSFNTEEEKEPATEYAMLRVYEGYKEEIVFFHNGESKGYKLGMKHIELEKETTKIVNEYLLAGWKLTSTDFMPGTNDGDGSVKNIKYYHFVRVKK